MSGPESLCLLPIDPDVELSAILEVLNLWVAIPMRLNDPFTGSPKPTGKQMFTLYFITVGKISYEVATKIIFILGVTLTRGL